jgi:hypothetical protein
MTAVVVGTTLRPRKASCKWAASPGGIITGSTGFRKLSTFGFTFSDAHPGSFCPKSHQTDQDQHSIPRRKTGIQVNQNSGSTAVAISVQFLSITIT